MSSKAPRAKRRPRWKAGPAAKLLVAAAQSGSRTSDSTESALRLMSVIHALERNALPSPLDLKWLLDGLKSYANQGASPESLDWHLALTPTESEGPGSKIARVATRFRDGQYCLRMTMYVAAGYKMQDAAKAVVSDFAEVVHGPRAPLPLAGLSTAKPMNADTLARTYRKWKAQPGFEEARAAMEAVHSDEIARLRSARAAKGRSP